MSNLIEPFLEMMIVERGAAQNTVAAYRRDLDHFYQSSPQKDLTKITPDDLRTYLNALHQAHLSPSSRARKLSTLRQFYTFLFSEGLIPDNPCHLLESPKKGRSLPKILSEAQVTRLMDTAYQETTPDALRLQVLLEILYASGLRVSELLSLPLSAVPQALETGVLRVRGKGDKERLVPLSEPSLEALQRYLSVRDHFGTDSPWVFPSSGKLGHLTRQRFDQLLKALGVKAGLERAMLSAHVLRHAFATHLLHNGADLISVQKLLGHANISTTEIYTHVLPHHLKDMVEAHHPLAKKA